MSNVEIMKKYKKYMKKMNNSKYEESICDIELPSLTNIEGNDEKEYYIPNFEWCRKAKYEVQIERACYKIDETHPLLDGFEEKEFEIDGVVEKYAVKSGTNILEQNNWTSSPERPYVITGTVGERWPVKESNLSAYDVNSEDLCIEPIPVSTKDPKDQEFLVAVRIPMGTIVKVIPKWSFRKDGTIDESQVMVANSESATVSHQSGDYVVAKHIEGKPEYMELSEEERNTEEAARLYDPRIINGSVMATTYDHAHTKEEIEKKYKKKTKILEQYVK